MTLCGGLFPVSAVCFDAIVKSSVSCYNKAAYNLGKRLFRTLLRSRQEGVRMIRGDTGNGY